MDEDRSAPFVARGGGPADRTLQPGKWWWDADASDSQTAELRALHTQRVSRRAGADFLHRSRTPQAVYMLTIGWTCSYQLLENGDRQIINLQLPGDFVGLQGVFLGTSNMSFQAVTDVELLEIRAADFDGAVKQSRQFLASVFRAASREEAMLVERLTNLGRRDASQNLAHFLLETGVRLSNVRLGSEAGYQCPLSQDAIADVLGLSSVHVNRLLRHFREERMMTFRDGFVAFQDYGRLVKLAKFDPDYLTEADSVCDLVMGLE